MKIPAIVSVDDHVVEPPHLFQRWLPERFRESGPRVIRTPYQPGQGYRQPYKPSATGPVADCWMIGDMPQFVLNQLVAVGLESHELDGRPADFSSMRPGFIDPQQRLVDMDAVQVERSLCFPNSMRFCGQMFLWLADKELALACVRAYNDWMVDEWCGDSGGRLIPLCVVPMWDPQLAAQEVRHNAERGVRAVTFSELPAALDLPSIHDQDGHWLPFVEACDETGTVICLHIGSSSTIPRTSADAPPAVSIASTSFNAQLSLVDWLLSGLLARFPRLKLAFSESQIGWMPFVLERVDRIWRMNNDLARVPTEIVEPPSSYMADRVFGCFFEDDFGVASRAAIGVDQITFEGDYPHQDSTWPDTHRYLTRILAGLDAVDVHKIVRGNALRMLGLPDVPLCEQAV